MAWGKEAQNAYMKRYYVENKERLLAQNQEWRSRNKERHLANAREYHHKNREALLEAKRQKRVENPEHYRALRFKRIYGITNEEHAAMRLVQGDRCAVCCRELPLVVDHDHATGKVRGLLCSPCNTAIGLLEEDRDRFASAVHYLDDRQ